MPLHPIDVPARDEGAFLSFPMTDAGRVVRCHAQQGALDSMEQGRTGDAHDRIDRFRRHRALFEAVASDLYDAGLPLRITADHVSWLKRFALARHRTVPV